MSLWHALRDLCGIWGLIALCPLYLFALLRGDPTGRAFAHVLALGALFGTITVTGRADTGPLRLAGDSQLGFGALLLAAQVVLTLRSPWHYPIAIAAAQLLIVFAAAFASAGLIAQPATALWLGGLPGAIQLGAFSYGLITHRNRRRDKVLKPKFAARTGQTA